MVHIHSKSRLRLLLLATILTVSAAVLVRDYWYSLFVSKAVQENDIREAVLRNLMSDELPGHRPPGEIYCISVEGAGDPEKDFLARFRGHTPPLRVGSDCIGGFRQVVENRTGRPASSLHLGKIHWTDRFSAEMSASWACGPLCGYGGSFVIERKGGRWVVWMLSGWIR